eukprot:TRINITY_DN2824_c1_g1_i2.p1 TRINITY_DN2824_c1_g1~~TRINITY_DN2824_c1_g1_i2.p1  ORF type:complete len:1159 (+),score=442.98 TRINITY_DN2824_c1_g1_i2:49-3525(+)
MSCDAQYLEVNVIEGRDLAPKDRSGTSDPYLILKVEKRKDKTAVVWKTLSPNWNQLFTFPVKDAGTAVLSIVCWDKDVNSSDDFMGQIAIPINEIREKAEMDDWFKLEPHPKKKDFVSGDIHLNLKFREMKHEVSSEDKAEALKKFHTRFPQIPLEENVQEVYHGSLYFSGVPVHGTIYSTNNFVCFYKSFLGKKNKSIIPLANVKSIEKKNSAYIVPNAIEFITLDNAHHFFTGLSHRDRIFDEIFTLWDKIKNPESRSRSGSAETAGNLGNSGNSGNLGSSGNTTPRGSAERKRGSSLIGKITSVIPLHNSPHPVLELSVEFNGKFTDIIVDGTKSVHNAMRTIGESLGIDEEEIDLYDLYYKKKKKLEKSFPIHHYELSNKSVVTLTKPKKRVQLVTDIPALPYKSFEEKYNLSGRSATSDETLLELALHCLYFPVYSQTNPDSGNQISQVLRDALHVPTDIYETIISRVRKHGPTIESSLVDLQFRMYCVNDRVFYTPQNFKNAGDYESWKKRELEQIGVLMKKLIFSDPNFYGNLKIKVVEAKDVKVMDVTGSSDPYVLLSVEDQKAKTKTKKRTLSPVWNEEFEFGVTDPNGGVAIHIFDWDRTKSDDTIARYSQSIQALQLETFTDKWFKSKDGDLHLEFNYSFTHSNYLREWFQVYNNMGTNIKKPDIPVPPHNEFYQRLEKSLFTEISTSDNDGLNEESNWFLEEYSQRFGVGWPFTKIVRLQGLTFMLEPNRSQISDLEEVLTDVTRARSDTPLTIWEENQLAEANEELLVRVGNFLTDMKKLFPKNQPRGVVASLCDILGMIVDTQESGISHLTKFIEAGIHARYVALYPHSKHHNHRDATPDELYDIVLKIQDEIQDDATFAPSFPEIFNYQQVSLQKWMSLLQVDLEHFSEKATFSNTCIEIYLILKKLLEGNSQLEISQNLPKIFAPFLYGWIKSVDLRLKEWIDGACTQSKKTPVSETERYSTSVVDVFGAISQSLREMGALEIRDPFMILQMTEVVCQAAVKYSQRILSDAQASLLKLNSNLKISRSSPEFSFTVSPEICVALNDLSIARIHMDDLTPKVEDELKKCPMGTAAAECNKETFDKCISDTFHQLKTSRDTLQLEVGQGTAQSILAKMMASVHSNSQELSTLIIDYLGIFNLNST